MWNSCKSPISAPNVTLRLPGKNDICFPTCFRGKELRAMASSSQNYGSQDLSLLSLRAVVSFLVCPIENRIAYIFVHSTPLSFVWRGFVFVVTIKVSDFKKGAS